MHIKAWHLYFAVGLLVAASHLLHWFGIQHALVFLMHAVVGLLLIGGALTGMLRPAIRLINVSSTFSDISRDRNRVHELHRQLVEKGSRLVKSIRDLHTILEGTVAVLRQEQERTLREPLQQALTDIEQQKQGAEELAQLAAELDAAVREDTERIRRRQVETSGYLRMQAQFQMMDNFWNEIHGFLFLTLGFGFLYYGVWAFCKSIGVAAFLTPSTASITLSDFLYYSVVTVSTVGYGEISPAIWVSQTLVVIQIVIGVAFIVGILGVLISLLSSEEFFKKRAHHEAGLTEPVRYAEELEEWSEESGRESQRLSERVSERLSILSREFAELWEKHRQTLQRFGVG